MDRIDELKKLNGIYSTNKVTVDDLFLKDNNGKTYFEYIVANRVNIGDDNILSYISNNYDMLLYAIDNRYFLNKYFNIDLLFDESRGMSLIESIFLKRSVKVSTMSADIINRLFEKRSGSYMFEKFLNDDYYAAVSLIEKVKNFDTLYSCFSDINKLGLMKYSNENCLLSKNPDGEVMVEYLIDSGEHIDVSVKSHRLAKIMFDKEQYDDMLNFDASILMNYPDATNNYLNMLISKGANFDNVYFHSDNNKDLANLYITLLRNNINFNKNVYNIIDVYDYSNCKPVILFMLEMDRELTIKNFNTENMIDKIKNYIVNTMEIAREDININSIDDIFNYLPDSKKTISKLKDGSIKKITVKDIFREDLLLDIGDNKTVLDYALNNNIKVYDYFIPRTVEEAKIVLEYKKHSVIAEKLLYEKDNNGKIFIDYLFEKKYYSVIRNANQDDLSIMDYCVKYNYYNVLSDQILNELFVLHDGHFLCEKYLNNSGFLDRIKNCDLPKEKMLKLYEMGYPNLLCNAKEDVLLTKYGDETVLEKLLDSNISPSFYGYDFKSLETIKILQKHNRPDLMYNASLELLMNYPDKENNYMQYLIDCYKQGINVNFELKEYRNNDKELLARCYIQMAKNGLVGFLNNLEENDLISSKDGGKNLLYYLISIDKNTTLDEILNFRLKKSKKVFAELKLLGVDTGFLDVSYGKYNCADIYREVFREKYTDGIDSPVIEKLELLRKLFEEDKTSNMDLVDALITSYKYCTSINPVFISELDKLIEAKQQNPSFCYLSKPNTGYFDRISKKIAVENDTISTLNHETGHALHYFLTDYAIPQGYEELISSISADSEWVDRVEAYSDRYQEVLDQVLERSRDIVSKRVRPSKNDEDNQTIDSLLGEEKNKLIQQYIKSGYSEETLSTILAGSFTIDEFVKQKKQIEIREVANAILRSEYDALISIGDIVDAISSGKYRSGVLKNKKGKALPPAFGHGVRYFSRRNKKDSLEAKFTEMVANYSTIIKSKNSGEILELLRYTVGDELVDMLDDFYKTKMLSISNQKGVSK